MCSDAQSGPTLYDPMGFSPAGSSVHGDSPGKNTGMGCQAFLQGIFPTQGLNPGFLHYRRILYCLSHHRNPRTLEWVAYPFSKGSSQPRNQTRVSCIAGRFFTSWATREARMMEWTYNQEKDTVMITIKCIEPNHSINNIPNLVKDSYCATSKDAMLILWININKQRIIQSKKH